MERKSISKGLRYSVLERDQHICQYCGARAPEVRLTIDHLIPVSAGGTNEPDNLITACFDCNIGKASKMTLRMVDNSDLQVRLEAGLKRRQILRATFQAAKQSAEARERRTWVVAEYWVRRFRGDKAKLEIPSGFFAGLSNLLDEIETEDVLPLIDSCANKFHGGMIRREEDAVRYFYGCIKCIRKERCEVST